MLLVLKCSTMQMPLFARVTALKLDDWCSFCQSAQEVFITSFKVLDIPMYAGDGFLAASCSNITWEKSHFLWIGSFWSWGRDLLIPCCYSWWNLVHHVEPGTEGNASDGTILSLPGRKNPKLLLYWTGLWPLSSGMWISDFCGCDAKRGDCHLWCLHQDADRSRDSFRRSSDSQHKSSFKMTMQDHTHTFEDLESCHKLWLVKYCVHPSPDQAPSDFCLFGVWGMQSIVRSTTYNNVIWTVRTWMWAGKDLLPTRRTSTCSLLLKGCRNGWSLCGKIGYGV